MNYSIAQLKTNLSTATVAASAGVASMADRVFVMMGEQDMTGPINMGRLPCIYLYSLSNSYEFQAEPDHQGGRTSEYVVRLLVPNFINRSEAQYLRLESFKQAVLKEVTSNAKLGITDVREEAAVASQMSIHCDLRLTANTSYDTSYSET